MLKFIGKMGKKEADQEKNLNTSHVEVYLFHTFTFFPSLSI